MKITIKCSQAELGLVFHCRLHRSTKNFFSKGTVCEIDFRVYWGRWTQICI